MNDPALDAGRENLLGLLRAEESWTDTLQRVATLACATIPGCESGSVTLWREGQPYTIVSTDDLARTIDDGQYDAMEGPCLDASRYGETYVVSDMRGEQRWPTFAGVAAQRGALSSLSVPLVVRDEPIGALNLYATKADGFLDGERAGQAFAKQASVAIANAQVYDASRRLAESLEAALHASAEIEQAKGRALAERAFRQNAPGEASAPPTLEG